MKALNLIIFFWIHVLVKSQTTEEDDRTLLKDLLRQSKDQNRKLEQQMNRMKLMWNGFHQMCSAIGASSCDCKVDDNKDSTSFERQISNQKEDSDSKGITILSVSSGGLEEDESVKLSVVYTAGKDHKIDWKAPSYYNDFGEYDLYRTAGKKSKLGKNKYSTSIRIRKSYETNNIICSFLSETEILYLEFEMRNIVNKSVQDIDSYESYIVDFNHHEVAPNDGDLVVSLEIAEEDLENSVIATDSSLYFTGLRTDDTLLETAAWKVFEIYPFNKTTISISSRKKAGDTSWLDVTVPERYSKFGGILTVLLPIKTKDQQMEGNVLKKLLYGASIYVSSPDTKEIIRKDSVGLLELKKETLVYKEQQTLSCIAMGNPRPSVKLLKHINGGRTKTLKTENYALDNFTQLAVFTMNKKIARSPKNLTCRAASGSGLTEQTTLVKLATLIGFDTEETGVMKNSTEALVFGCKASWSTNPDLTFRLYEEQGPELTDNDYITVVRQNVGSKTSKLTLTISPRNDAIHTVYCIAKTTDGRQIKSQKIEVFPGEYPSWDWALFDEMVNLEGGTRSEDYINFQT